MWFSIRHVVDERDQLARRFIIPASAREVWDRHVAQKQSEESISGFRGFDETHIRNCWFDGRVHVCAAEHLRGVAPDEGDRWDMDESRQVDELL